MSSSRKRIGFWAYNIFKLATDFKGPLRGSAVSSVEWDCYVWHLDGLLGRWDDGWSTRTFYFSLLVKTLNSSDRSFVTGSQKPGKEIWRRGHREENYPGKKSKFILRTTVSLPDTRSDFSTSHMTTNSKWSWSRGRCACSVWFLREQI